MPTKRTWTFLIIAAVLYFLANQTQVGWIYVFVATIVGLLLVSFVTERGLLKSIRVERTLRNTSASPPEGASVSPDDDLGAALAQASFYEDDPLEVTLRFQRRGMWPIFALSGQEMCPCAPPAEQTQPFFIPTLFPRRPVTLRYETRCDRRGGFTFPDVTLRSRGAFGFFATRRTLAAPGNLLIYPQYHRLKRLALLERRAFGQQQTDRVGQGTQVIGTREYRTGDSLRQVHWRSTARRNQLIVKEFSDDDQRSLTVVLDLAGDSSLGRGKWATFETAVRLAASFGYYADRRQMPFQLIGAARRGSPPTGTLSWWGTLAYLARVRNDGDTPLPQVVATLSPSPFVIILISHPQPEIVPALTTLSRKNQKALALVITPAGTLPDFMRSLAAPGLTVRAIESGETWAAGLEGL